MGTATPITHVFSEINEGKYKSVKHYELIEVNNGTTQLSQLINISKNQNCAQSMPDYWLKVRNGNKWSNCITGIFKTGFSNIYKGDTQKKKNLIVFKFSDNSKTLTVYFFKDYYTKYLSKFLQTINQ
jgi:hypothetical protein